jgi:hypothetical protein
MSVHLRKAVVALALLAVAVGACKSKSSAAGGAAAKASSLTDLSPSLDAIRVAFNAHKQEARFLTLLSPA